MSHRSNSLVHAGVVAMAALCLAACSGQQPLAEPAPAPTVTVTETPNPTPRDAADALTALDAWLACSAVARYNYDMANQVSGTDWSPFDPQWVTDNGDGTFAVEVPAKPAGAPFGILGQCTVGGTVASPELVSFGFIDLG